MTHQSSFKYRTNVAALIIAAALILTGCSGGGDTTPTPTPTPTPTNFLPSFITQARIHIEENTRRIPAISVADSDSENLTVKLIGGEDADKFDFDPSTNSLNFKACSINFERPHDANQDGIFQVDLEVSDGTDAVSQSFQIELTDNPNEPSIGSELAIRNSPTTTGNKFAFSSLGDLNCDGYPDLAILSGNGDGTSSPYIVSGALLNANADVEFHLDSALKIEGAELKIPNSYLSHYAANTLKNINSAGDVDGDGINDLLIAHISGHTHLIFGSSLISGNDFQSSLNFDDLELGVDRILIDGIGVNAVSLGDLDQDGKAEFALGSHGLNSSGTHSPAVIIFSKGIEEAKSNGGIIDANEPLGSLGVNIDGGRIYRVEFAYKKTMSSAGDIDGDGLIDLAFGFPTAWPLGEYSSYSGAAFIVTGRSIKEAYENNEIINLQTLETDNKGTHILGETYLAQLGYEIASAGDLDNDGKSELLVSYIRNQSGLTNARSGTLLVNGSFLTEQIEAGKKILRTEFGTAGSGKVLQPTTTTPKVGAGMAVSSAGDVDGDRIPDFMIGAPFAESTSPHGVANVKGGAVYIIFGKSIANGLDFNLDTLVSSNAGIKLESHTNFSTLVNMGGVLAALGDIDGDGLDDIGIAGITDKNGGRSIYFANDGQYGSILSIVSGQTILDAHNGDGVAYFGIP